jgi:hypothetical protein
LFQGEKIDKEEPHKKKNIRYSGKRRAADEIEDETLINQTID